MKKRLLVVAVILFSLVAISAAPSKYPFAISGVVRSDVVFLVSIFEDTIPFDLDSSLVNYNSSYESFATGIRIGTYTLVSRMTGIKLCVEHTPLVHTDTSLTEHNQINYRLYMMTDEGNPGFESTSGELLEIFGADIIDSESGVISLIDEYMYVTLDEGSAAATEAVRSELETGTYRSTITFSVWMQT